jgi:hypothetical protein
MGSWIAAAVTAVLTGALVWLTPRLRLFNPIRAHWVRPAGSTWQGALSRVFWSMYHSLSRLSSTLSTTLEGEGGIMWTLLFLALLISFLTRGSP